MRIKKFIVFVLLLIGILVGSYWGIRNYVYPYNHKVYVDKYSEQYDLDPLFVLSVMKTESNFVQEAKSHKNARGLMQITPDTGKWICEKMQLGEFNEDMLYEEETNIMMGCWYLDNLRKQFGDLDLAVIAYNAGRGNLDKWLKDEKYSSDGKTLEYIPFQETDKYLKKVKVNYNIYQFFYKDGYAVELLSNLKKKLRE